MRSLSAPRAAEDRAFDDVYLDTELGSDRCRTEVSEWSYAYRTGEVPGLTS